LTSIARSLMIMARKAGGSGEPPLPLVR
jgi:hypothetical protein